MRPPLRSLASQPARPPDRRQPARYEPIERANERAQPAICISRPSISEQAAKQASSCARGGYLSVRAGCCILNRYRPPAACKASGGLAPDNRRSSLSSSQQQQQQQCPVQGVSGQNVRKSMLELLELPASGFARFARVSARGFAQAGGTTIPDARTHGQTDGPTKITLARLGATQT